MFDQENFILKVSSLENYTTNIINWWWHLA